MYAWISRVVRFSAKHAFSRFAMLTAVGMIGFLASIALWNVAHQYEEERLHSLFQHGVEQYARELSEEIELQAQQLRALRNLFLFSRKVTRSEFSGAVREVITEFPGLQTVQWVVRIPGSGRSKFEENLRKEGFYPYQIRERSSSGVLVPAQVHPEYFVVAYVEPMIGNEAVIGFNAGTGWTQKEFALARDSGQVIGSAAIFPVIPTQGQLATVLICPVYAIPVNAARESEIQKQLIGFLQAILRLPALFEQAWREVKTPGLNIVVTDQTPGAQYRVLHRSDPLASTYAGVDVDLSAFHKGLYREVPITALRREWRLLIHASPDWIRANTAWSPLMILLGGFLFTSLALINLNSIAKRAETVAMLVQQRTAELTQSKERLRLALESAEMGAWDWDIQSDRLTSSGTLEKIHEIAEGAFEGNSEQFVKCVHPDDRNCLRAAIGRAIRDEEPFHVQVRNVCPNGSVRWLAIDGRLLNDALLKRSRMVGVARDITDRKLAEDALHTALMREQNSRADAEAASRAKDQFLAALSHELRTPLTPVVALLPTLLDLRTLPQDVRDDLLLIKRNVDLETRLIDDLLDVTHITKGQFHLNLQNTGVHTLIGQTLQIVGGDAAAKKITIVQELHALNPCTWGDPARLQQVFWNVLKNAVKFTPKGGTIWVKTCNPEPKALEIEIADTGIGIDPDKLSGIFNAFVQSSPTHSHRFGGLGLGLFITNAIVQQHCGTIEAFSEGEGRGTRFRIRFKAAESVGCEEEPRPQETKFEDHTLRVLLVEDHKNTREVLERLLRKRGYKIMAADCVKAATELANAQEFDLLVSDIGLPDGSGLDLMANLKNRPGLQGIALSGFGMEADIRKSREAGFAAHLTKPVEFRQLEATIRELANLT